MYNPIFNIIYCQVNRDLDLECYDLDIFMFKLVKTYLNRESFCSIN